jgi:hypothetical protein
LPLLLPSVIPAKTGIQVLLYLSSAKYSPLASHKFGGKIGKLAELKKKKGRVL